MSSFEFILLCATLALGIAAAAAGNLVLFVACVIGLLAISFCVGLALAAALVRLGA